MAKRDWRIRTGTKREQKYYRLARARYAYEFADLYPNRRALTSRARPTRERLAVAGQEGN
jgi:hypothetical protein